MYISKQTNVKTIISSGFNKNRSPARLANKPGFADPWCRGNPDKPRGSQTSVEQERHRGKH